jgi:2-polyprenyl-6-methoxyphenol hydroxylase-like FAD-dependent oxidoreductase
MSAPVDCDVAVVGASLAGCTAALLLGRAGARVALVERREDPQAFKRICGHYIQPSAVATLERIGLLDPILAAGGVRSALRLWTPWGVIDPVDPAVVPKGVNIRRELLDPLVRELAAAQDGVELLLGETVIGLERDGEGFCGVQLRDRRGGGRSVRARLVVAADGRTSPVAELAAVPKRVSRHGRFSYAAYYEGPPPAGSPDGRLWLLDPQWGAAFPTDAGLTMYACMPTKDSLPEFRRGLDAALTSFIAGLPDPPPIRESRRVGPILGKIEMPNVQRSPVAPGLALVGDAALATDPLWGVGCGWAFQTAEWMADAVSGPLVDGTPLDTGLDRYRRRFRRGLAGHAFMIRDYARGRRMSPIERLLFSSAVHDRRAAEVLSRFGARMAGPQTLLSPALAARIPVAQLRRRRAGRGKLAAAATADRRRPRDEGRSDLPVVPEGVRDPTHAPPMLLGHR